jgi:hypothetical protein
MFRTSYYILFALSSFLPLILSCEQDTGFSTSIPKNIVRTNKMRRLLGIREIDVQNWEFYGMDLESMEETWMHKGYQAKKIKYSYLSDGKEVIEWEEDYYYSGRKYRPLDPDAGLNQECLAVYYNYNTARLYISYAGPLSAVQNHIINQGYSRVDIGPQNFSDFKEVKDYANDVLTSMGLYSESYP